MRPSEAFGSPARAGSRRLRRAWVSVAAVAAGTAALTGGAWWLQHVRETDLRSAAGSVTTSAILAIPDEAPAIRFTDVAAASGLTMRHGPGVRSHALPEDTGSGLAWGDVDGDGDLDLYVVNFAPLSVQRGGGTGALDGGNRLFRNDGGRFVDVAATAGVADAEGFGMGASFADYDADGDVDLYVTNFGPNRLFRNGGDGTFDEVGAWAGVADPRWSTGAAWGDYDRDGHLDLYVANYVEWDTGSLAAAVDLDSEFPFTLNPNAYSPAGNRLYRNRGNGTFEEVAAAAGVEDADGRSLNAVFCDLDGDGWLDLFVANDASPNRLFRNRGAGAGGHRGFEDLSAATGMADTRSGMGLSVLDVAGGGGGGAPAVAGGSTGSPDATGDPEDATRATDAEADAPAGAAARNPSAGPDGWPDLFVANWVAQDNALFRAVVEGDQLAEFHDDARAFGLAEVSTQMVGWGTLAADIDLDGRTDLVVANGSTLQQPGRPRLLQPQPAFVFWNGGGRFYDVAPAAGDALAAAHDGRGLAGADFDGDGDVDVAIAVNRGAPLLLRNDTVTANHGLAVALDASDALRFGARIRVTVGEVTQARWVGGDASYLSMHAPDLPFGLGAATVADRVEVTWADGSTTVREGVPAGRVRLGRGGG